MKQKMKTGGQRHLSVLGRPSARQVGSAQNILKKAVYKDFFSYVLKGISMYAHRARDCATATDPEVDSFVAEALALMAADTPLTVDDLHGLISRALEMRLRANQLYEQACERCAEKPEDLSGPATMTIFAEPRTIPAQARGLGARKLSGERTRDDYYWEGVCMDKLITLGGMATSSDKEKFGNYDIYGLLHTALNILSRDLRAYELIALFDKMEKESLRFANALASGDTWVEVPASCRQLISKIRRENRRTE